MVSYSQAGQEVLQYLEYTFPAGLKKIVPITEFLSLIQPIHCVQVDRLAVEFTSYTPSFLHLKLAGVPLSGQYTVLPAGATLTPPWGTLYTSQEGDH